jgi:hypothetical protein
MSQLIKIDKEYALWISELSIRFKSMQLKAATKVNHEMLAFYWALGKDIEKTQAEQKWGSSFFATLSMDLRTVLPGQEGFSETNIRYMKRFYVLYSQILPQAVEEFGDSENLPQLVEDLRDNIDNLMNEALLLGAQLDKNTLDTDVFMAAANNLTLA